MPGEPSKDLFIPDMPLQGGMPGIFPEKPLKCHYIKAGSLINSKLYKSFISVNTISFKVSVYVKYLSYT